jgi:hypothetical protein
MKAMWISYNELRVIHIPCENAVDITQPGNNLLPEQDHPARAHHLQKIPMKFVTGIPANKN